MNIRGINDVYGVGELEATDSALIEAHERGHDLGDWQRMRFDYSLIAVCSDIDPCCIYAPKAACYRRPRQEDRGHRKGCIWLSKATWVNFTAKCCRIKVKVDWLMMNGKGE